MPASKWLDHSYLGVLPYISGNLQPAYVSISYAQILTSTRIRNVQHKINVTYEFCTENFEIGLLRGDLLIARLPLPRTQSAPKRYQLSHVVSVVISDEKCLAQYRLP